MSLEAKIEALTVAVEALTAALSATEVRKPRAKPEAADTTKMAQAVVEAAKGNVEIASHLAAAAMMSVEAPVVEAPAVEAPVVETLVVDMEVLKAKFRQFMSARGSADARAMLTEFGVPPTGKLVDLPADKYGAMHAKLCEELGG